MLLLIGANIAGYHLISKKAIYKDYIIQEKKIQTSRSILLGDSHSNAIRQVDLDSIGIVNFSYDGDSYFDILSKLEYVLARNKPDTIYLCVDDHTLSRYRESWMNKGRSIYYAPYSVYRDYYNYSRFWFAYKKYWQTHLPFFNTKNSKILGAYLLSGNKSQSEHDYRNFNFGSVPKQDRMKRSESRIQTQFPSPESSVFLRRCLQEIIDKCQKNDIALIGLKFPLTSDYLQYLGNQSYHADTVLLSRGIAVWDFTYSMVNRDSLFRDQDHVNNIGSKVFIGLLEERISITQRKEKISGSLPTR
ncbi:MAG: hypothetical protein ACOYXB_05830 [Bacteroidota bacterium]